MNLPRKKLHKINRYKKQLSRFNSNWFYMEVYEILNKNGCQNMQAVIG